MLEITNEISRFINTERLCFVATVTPDAKPNISPKGSILQRSPTQLAFAEIRSPDTINNLKSNPAIEINIISPVARRGYLFRGRGRILYSGHDFNEVMVLVRNIGIKSAVRAIVLVDVDHIEEVKSPLYDLGYSEEQIRSVWSKRYSE